MSGLEANVDLIIISLLVGIMIMAVYYVYKRINDSAKALNMNLADYINDNIISEMGSLILLCLVLLNVGEGVVAASTHRPEELPLSPAVRILIHVSLALISIFFMLYLPNLIKDWLGEFEKGYKNNRDSKSISESVRKIIIGIPLIILGLLVAVGVPYINLIIISKGLSQSDYDAAIAAFDFIITYPLPDTWSSYDHPDGALWIYLEDMSKTMSSSFMIVLSHYFVTIFESLLHIYNGVRKSKQVGEEGQRSYLKDIDKGKINSTSSMDLKIAYLLRKMTKKLNWGDSGLTRISKEFMTILEDIPDTSESATMLAQLNNVINGWISLSRNTTYKSDKIIAMEKGLLGKTKDFFENKRKGLGISIPMNLENGDFSPSDQTGRFN